MLVFNSSSIFRGRKNMCRLLHGAIVGSGPSGMYLASNLLKHGPENLKIDFVERLEFPYGLVRYGVAPDHQDVKNVTETFEKVFKEKNVRLISNVSVGEDVSLAYLQSIYDFVVLSYGQFKSKELFFENKDSFKNFYTASEFVSWYNNYPNAKKVCLKNVKSAVVVGNGNVALDVARILMSDKDDLKVFDVPDDVLSEFDKNNNNIENIYVIARGDIYSANFTVKELRDCYKRFSSKFAFNIFFNSENEFVVDHPQKGRLLKLMNTFNKNTFFDPPKNSKNLNFVYKEQIDQLLPNTSQIKLKKSTNATIDCDLLVTCIGFQGESLDPDRIKFDPTKGCIEHNNGKVINTHTKEIIPFLYCNGWIKTGPRGNIASTVIDAYETGQIILDDLKKNFNKPEISTISISQDPLNLIKTKLSGKKNIYSFHDWQNTDLVEKSLGVRKGKVREKLDHVLTNNK